ncbi:unnamed protein product [Brassicogethes aeneus]|uniref:Pericentrin/AKAP-450 centrosomal targeting domain-containing protein n=1 Tax=Brassicogethes aeneus TaxID=1431903 RepID=A0A9P0FRW6_BRAAE|nr:unnamed protein product [Brassicogethes aeneus]
MEEDSPENAVQKSQNPESKVDVETLNSTDSSLSLSLSISEHIENDRSFQEIEVNNQSFLNLTLNDDVRLSQTSNPFSLNNSERSVSVNFKNSADENVESVLNEILNNPDFKSASNTLSNNSQEESLNIFANLDLDDKSLSLFRQGDLSDLNERNKGGDNYGDVVKRIKEFEEILNVKDTAIQALTSELDSYREMSNTNTMSIISTTEYKQLQEECQNKLLEYNDAILYKNDLIQQLSESLDQSVLERKLLLAQIDSFKDEIAQLQGQLEVTTEMVKSHQCSNNKKTEINEDDADSSQKQIAQPFSSINYKSIESSLNNEQLSLFKDIKCNVDKFIEQQLEEKKIANEKEIENIKSAMLSEKEEYESEIKRLRDMLANIKCGSTEIMELRNELEAKYSKEVEELRTYFEKKCCDLEKNYSEEVFSQHSRKMSGSSCSENELSSDVFFGAVPGPGGDAPPDRKPLAEKDVHKLREDLRSILKTIENCDLKEEDLNLLRDDLSKCSISEILKYDVSCAKDLRNKYNAELIILSEENENKADVMKVEFERKLKDLEDKYEDEIRNLKSQVQVYNVSSSIQEVRLVADESDDDEWPSELLQLRDRFADKYERQILETRLRHEEEMAALKEEHLKALNGALERARRRSLRDSDSLNKGEMELLKERDSLRKQTVSLRNLLGELLKYFTQCEDELNNTLVDELLKQGFEKNLTQLEDLNDSSATTSSKTDTSSYVKRVHLAPNFSDLIGLIEKQVNSEADEFSLDASTDFKNELGHCLFKLKQDANAILALTNNIPRADLMDSPRKSLDEKVTSLTRQLISETQTKEKLKQELEDATSVIASMEKEKYQLENELETIILKDNLLESDLLKAKDKIAELIENGHKEIVSVGYGGGEQKDLGDAMQNLLDLQEKARNVLAKSVASADPVLLNLIEDLCRVCEVVKEEHRKEKVDLLQQVCVGTTHSSEKIEAADKKYRQTRQFLDEQANEREAERDEAQKKIDMLQERLRERDRDRTSCQRYTSEETNPQCTECSQSKNTVEHLESQIQDLNSALSEEVRKLKESESERDEAVEKIKVLREIIRELEAQTESCQTELKSNLETIEKLRCMIESQNRSLEDTQATHSLFGFSDVQELRRHVDGLEGELQQLRVSSELAGSEGAASKVRLQLQELEVALERKTKSLEGLYCGTNNSCSSPSEDLSVRDLLRPHTPNSMVFDDCEVPLAQLARLKEKLVRHSRAEDAAIKKIRDLEMQVFNLKSDVEENCGEKETLKRQIQEHLVLISDLQIRLDEQRIRAEHNEKQINNSLEVKIYDLQSEIANLNELLQKKDKNINHLSGIVEETKRLLKSQEQELLNHQDDEMIASMQKELERVRVENLQLKNKMSKDAQMLPNLVENIISDKNTDIDKLNDKLADTQRKLQDYTSLNLDLKELQTLSHLKQSGNSLTEILSLIDTSQPDQMRYLYESKNDSPAPDFKRNKNETVFLSCEPEISRIERLQPVPLLKSNSTELYKSMEKRVHFEDDMLEKLQGEIKVKEEVIKECEQRLSHFEDLEQKIEKLQTALESTEEALNKAQETFETEQKEGHEREQNLRLELAEKKMKLSEREKEVSLLEKDSNRKDQMLLDLSREKKDLEKELTHIKHENYQTVDRVINEKNEEIYELQQREKENAENVVNLRNEIAKLNSALQENRVNLDNVLTLKKKYEEETEKTAKLEKEIANHNRIVNEYKTEFDNLKSKIAKKREKLHDLEKTCKTHEGEIKTLKDENKNYSNLLLDKNCEIEILNEDLKHYQTKCNEYEDQNGLQSMEKLQKVVDEKEQIILNVMKKNEELNNELLHLQDLVGNKDKIIDKISDDHKKVNANLVTIQNKFREGGGLIETRHKLKEEQKKNVNLLNELHTLKAQMINVESKRNINDVEDIASKVKRELDLSAELDCNIITAVSDQSLTSISDTHDLEKLKEELNKVRAKNSELCRKKKLLEKDLRDSETKLEVSENAKLSLESQLDIMKYNLQKVQFEDARLIEQMRLRLDTAMGNEEEFGRIIDEEKVVRKNLEVELEHLKFKQSNSKTESTQYKNLPSNEDKYRNELKLEREKYEKAKRAFKQSEASRKEVENNLNCVKKMLDLERERTHSMEERLKCLVESDRELKETARKSKLQLEQKLWEIERLKGNVSELQKEKNNAVLNSTNPFLEEPVHEIVMNKIREINGLLLDDKAMVDLINKLRNEKAQVERELINFKSRNPNLAENSDLKNRCDFLFAKNLKLNSNKKALLYQKRYLMNVINHHEVRCKVLLLGTVKGTKPTVGRPKLKFRSVVTAVITIFRMRYMVRRWRSGIRATCALNSRYSSGTGGRPETTARASLAEPLDFHVGQPVSNSRFSAGTAYPGTSKEAKPEPESAKSNVSWSGNTPPQKERRAAAMRIGNHLLKQEDLQPLKAPQLLAQFVDRIHTIQETMGLALDSDSDVVIN